MLKNSSFLTITLSLALLLLLWGARPSQAAITTGTGEGGLCCTCFSDTCCFGHDAEDCNSEGHLTDLAILENFFAYIGIQGSEICDICDQCPDPPTPIDPNNPTFDPCSICIFEPGFAEHECQILPPEDVQQFEEITGSSCSHFGSGFPASAGDFAILGGIAMLLGLRLRKVARS